MRLNSVKYLMNQGASNIWKNKVMAFASFCVLLVSLLLVGFSMLFYYYISTTVSNIEDKNEVLVFLKEDVSDEVINGVQKNLKEMDNIKSIEFYSKEQAFADLKGSMPDYQILFDSLGDDNPLVDSFKVKVSDINKMNDTVVEIDKIGEVDSIRAPIDFADTLIELKKTVSIVSLSIITALIIVSMVIISNATKASVFARRKEISIMKYVGATNAFIRIPFFVEGMITGVFSGLVSTIVTWFAYGSLIKVLAQQSNILNIIGVNTLLPFKAFALKILLSYIIAGALLGALGSVFSTRKHLKV